MIFCMKGKTNICPYDLCTGCAACVNVCSKGAISMVEDELGYIHPLINASLCVNCGLCEQICPVLHPLELNEPKTVYAAVSIDDKERMTSASGGAASVYSRYILEHGGIVYGCVQENYHDIKHLRIACLDELTLLKGSKYVQSNIGLSYRLVKRDLQSGAKVLFIGTPCQIAGLKSFLQKDYENLFAIDLICHGVPSQKMLRENVEMMWKGDKWKLNELSVNFRWKTYYGIQFGVQLLWDNKKMMTREMVHDPYMKAFMTGLSFRENCHNCFYGQSMRVGDLTIGDFWGLGAYKKTAFRVKRGVSLVLVNTSKGRELMNLVSNRFVLEVRTLNEAINGNANLRTASHRPIKKDSFKMIFKERGLKEACHACISRKSYVKMIMKENLKKVELLVCLFKRCRLFLNQWR